jgi:pSer/pThr/pTyr-binding forkhead associated (FHA) protein
VRERGDDYTREMNSYSDRPTDRAPPKTSGLRFYLRRDDRDVPLLEGSVVVGRSSACDVVLQDPRVSAEHARLTATTTELTVTDLDSRNGVFVNGTRVTGEAVLSATDLVAFAEVVFEVVAREVPDDDIHDSEWPTRVDVSSPFGHPLVDQTTPSQEAFDVLASVIDKALALGHVDEIAKMLNDRLSRIAEECEADSPIPNETIAMAARYALKCATLSGDGLWLNLLVRIYRARAETLPVEHIDVLYAAVRLMRDVDWSLLREYADVLKGRKGHVSPGERFAAKRIEGLLRFGPG